MTRKALAAALLAALAVGCGSMIPSEAPAAPLKEDVDPIRNTAMTIIPTYSFTYHARDEGEARHEFNGVILARLNRDGGPDGNSFSIASGARPNFNLHFTIYNDVNDRFTGSVSMEGWAWGHIANLGSGEYSFSTGADLTDALAGKVYEFIHTGWHDSRKNR